MPPSFLPGKYDVRYPSEEVIWHTVSHSWKFGARKMSSCGRKPEGVMHFCEEGQLLCVRYVTYVLRHFATTEAVKVVN